MSKTLYECIARAISVATKGRSQFKKQKQKNGNIWELTPSLPPCGNFRPICPFFCPFVAYSPVKKQSKNISGIWENPPPLFWKNSHIIPVFFIGASLTEKNFTIPSWHPPHLAHLAHLSIASAWHMFKASIASKVSHEHNPAIRLLTTPFIVLWWHTVPVRFGFWLRVGGMICDIEEEENCKEQTHDDNWTVQRPELLEDIIITLCFYHSSVFDWNLNQKSSKGTSRDFASNEKE